MSIYMKFGDFAGGVTTDGFKEWIELHSFQWGVGRAVGSAARSQETREGSEPSISEVVVSKRMDKSSPKLFQDAVGGDFSAKVLVKFTTTTKDKVETFLEYEFSDCGLSGYSASAGSSDAPTESLSINFAKVIWSYTARDAKIGGSALKVGYDLTQMKKV